MEFRYETLNLFPGGLATLFNICHINYIAVGMEER